MRIALFRHHLIQAGNAPKECKYLCPFCHQKLILRIPRDGHRYFAHYHHSVDCGGESTEHLKGKAQIARFFSTYSRNVKIEQYLSSIQQWPDVLVCDSTVIEFQCSPISKTVLTSRISGYAKLHLKSWWVLGKPYYQRKLGFKYLERFMRYSKYLGFYLTFWLTQWCCLEIQYQFREVNGKVFYRSKRLRTSLA